MTRTHPAQYRVRIRRCPGGPVLRVYVWRHGVWMPVTAPDVVAYALGVLPELVR